MHTLKPVLVKRHDHMTTDWGLNSLALTGREYVPLVGSSKKGWPNTPCNLETLKDGPGKNKRSNSSCKYRENVFGKRGAPKMEAHPRREVLKGKRRTVLQMAFQVGILSII